MAIKADLDRGGKTDVQSYREAFRLPPRRADMNRWNPGTGLCDINGE
jgi:hypothetical protein